ncbi:MAG: ZIP family metal transporter [Candidatus Taylorbacteria bacterium]|nr:ZIP family metal transporter [Candidatus Taylorbacteria bacterium]
MTLFFSAIAIFLAVILGGFFALKFKDKLHLMLGFSAGSVIGIAFFDLLPESFELGLEKYDFGFISSVIAIGFLSYMVLDRLIAPHGHHDESCENHSHKGIVGAASLSLHSLMDGLIVGLSFQISTELGIAVAAAIIVHAFSDGINVTNMILRVGGKISLARKWLLIGALAPVFGVIISIFVKIEETSLSLLVALFCGFFIYIGASDLLPESHHSHPKIWTTVATILGIILIFIVTQLAGI